MKTNALLTYLLYALLVGLIAVVGYKACQMKREQAEAAKENAEFQKTLRDLGYVDEDTTASQYAGEGAAAKEPPTTTANPAPGKTTPAVSHDGIEDEDPKPQASAAAPATSKAAARPETKSSAPATSTNDRVRDLDNEDDSADGRYRVVAGTFTKLDGARREMERLIKMGYHDAEVGRYNRGKYAVVIVKRTDSLNEANKLMDRLKAKGVDARVIDRKRKQ